MRITLFSLFAAGLLFAACNQSGKSGEAADGQDTSVSTVTVTKVDSANAPIMKFETESYNFGKVASGDKVEYEYKFTNTGKSPLVIAEATATCGCTVPEWPKKPVLPGESNSIKVSFDTNNKTGMQDKLITVTANTVPAQTVVHLVGEVTLKK